MAEFNEEIYRFQDSEYVIRIAKVNQECTVRGYRNNKPASFIYGVHQTARRGFITKFGYDPLLDLIKSVKADIASQRWET